MDKLKNGSFVISLDFELFWGVLDHHTKETYGKNVLGVYNALPAILKLFQQYNIHATVATVGFIFFDDKEDLLKHIPKDKPTYTNTIYSPYNDNRINRIQDSDKKLFFAPNLVNLLKEYKNIEIGTHTFCHYYCWEDGQTKEQFEEDIKQAIQITNQKNIKIRSIVFPRNNVSEDYLSICSKYGIISYRGNPNKFFKKGNSKLIRLMRFIDTYLNVGGSNIVEYQSIKTNYPVNISASRFLRSYNKKIALFDYFKIRRIKNEMTNAAKENKLYHLWWHPHNFGINTDKNLKLLTIILKHYQKLHAKYNFQSYTMSELTDLLTK